MVGVVILNYNNTCDLISCVKSLLEHSDEHKIRIVVVDNGSNEVVRNKVELALSELSKDLLCIDDLSKECRVLPLVSYLKLPKNVGYAKGNNAGISFLDKFPEVKYIMVLNSDILFTYNIIDPLVEQFEEQSDLGAISPILYRPNGDIDFCCARSAYDLVDLAFTFSYLFAFIYSKRIKKKQILFNNPEFRNIPLIEIDLPSGSCMLFTKSVLNQIGGFDPNTFLYYEEAILYEKLKLLGKKNVLITGLSCIHTGGATTNVTKTSSFLLKCNIDSLVYYMTTYMQAPYVILLYIRLTGNIRMCLLSILRELKRVLQKFVLVH